MSVLSETLTYFVNQRDRNIPELAIRCKIDRATLYQYLKGKRSFRNIAQLERIISELHLTPDERMKVMEAYEIEQIGLLNYNRRRKVKEILRSLLTVDEEGINVYDALGDPVSIEAGTDRLIKGELEVSRMVHYVIRRLKSRGGVIRILIQPDYAVLMEPLVLACSEHADIKVIQIICLESDSGQDGCSNLENIRRILRYGVGISCYEPRYYYGKSKEHYGLMNVMPCLAVTEEYAIQISSDHKAAILHNDAETIQYLTDFFDDICKETHPLMSRMDGAGVKLAGWGMDYAKTADFSNTVEMCSGLCRTQFWDERLIRKYLNPEIPDYKEMTESYITYSAALHEAYRQGQITVLTSMATAEEFVRTGVMKEYPEALFSGPLTPEDRRKIICRILKAAEEGWYHIHLVPEDEFPLSYLWEVIVNAGDRMLLQNVSHNQFRIFFFRERDVLDAVYDFLESIAAGRNVMSEEDSLNQLKAWEKEYLR